MARLVEKLMRGLFDERPIFDMNMKAISNSNGYAVSDAGNTGSKTYLSKALQIYHKLVDAIKRKGYEIIERSRSYLERTYGKGTRGYEDENWMEVEPGNTKAVLHEYAAKLLRGITGKSHKELHPQINAFAGTMEREAYALG